jgi:hypothetical protein
MNRISMEEALEAYRELCASMLQNRDTSSRAVADVYAERYAERLRGILGKL